MVPSGSNQEASRNFSSALAEDGSTYYFSSLLDGDGTSSDWRVRLLSSASSGDANFIIDIDDRTTPDGLINMRQWNGSSVVGETTSNVNISSGTALVVWAITLNAGTGDDSFEYWVNPDVGVSSPMNADYSSGSVTIDDFATLTGFNLFTDGDTDDRFVDEFRVGDDFGDVVPVPEPSAAVLLLGALGTLLITRRRR
jgi:hypothetical protein